MKTAPSFLEKYVAIPHSAKPITNANTYSYLNTTRFFSMFAIVFEHSFLLPNSERSLIEQFLMQIFKYGTVCFFLVSGFLIGVRQDYESKQTKYYFSRVKSVFVPWLIFSSLLILIKTVSNLIKINTFDITHALNEFFSTGKEIIFHTAYWFVPSYLITLIAFNILIKIKYCDISTFILSFVTTFFALNIYLNIIPSSHTTSIVAFLPILWLGYFIVKHQTEFLNIIIKIGKKKLYLLGIITLILQLIETYFINAAGVGDPFNTLRLSNLMYGIIVFCLFSHPDNSIQLPSFLNPRKSTFGIYLTHTLIGVVLGSVFKKLGLTDNLPSFYLLIVFFPLLYSLSTFLTLILHRTRLKFLLGG